MSNEELHVAESRVAVLRGRRGEAKVIRLTGDSALPEDPYDGEEVFVIYKGSSHKLTARGNFRFNFGHGTSMPNGFVKPSMASPDAVCFIKLLALEEEKMWLFADVEGTWTIDL